MNKKKLKSIIISALPIVLVPFMYFFVPFYRNNIGNHIMPCHIRLFLGIYCMGCGGTHCVYELSEGHILKALKYNAVLVFVILYLIIRWIENVFSVFGKNIKIIPESRKFYLTVSGISVAYFILRNFIPQLAPV